jgi:hypothetical protein
MVRVIGAGGRMRLIALVKDQKSIDRFLRGIGESTAFLTFPRPVALRASPHRDPGTPSPAPSCPSLSTNPRSPCGPRRRRAQADPARPQESTELPAGSLVGVYYAAGDEVPLSVFQTAAAVER